jgi:hypothetical protein
MSEKNSNNTIGVYENKGCLLYETYEAQSHCAESAGLLVLTLAIHILNS